MNFSIPTNKLYDDGMPMIEKNHGSYIRNSLKSKLPGKTLYFYTDYNTHTDNPLILLTGKEGMSPIFFNKINEEHLVQIRDRKAYLVYEIYAESGESWLRWLFAKCIKNKLPTDQVIVLSVSPDYVNYSKKLADSFNVEPIKIVVYNFFERNVKRRFVLDHVSKYMDIKETEFILEDTDIDYDAYGNIQKRFLYLNHRPRLYRCAVLSLLKQQNLLDHCYASFHDVKDSKYWDNALSTVNKDFNEPIRSMIIEGSDVHEMTPMTLDRLDDVHNPALKNHDSIIQYFKQSFFSLVSETFFSYHDKGFEGRDGNKECIFLTEKTFKCFAYKHPFILITLPKSLKYLHQLGYKTFDGIIDESYDDELDDSTRLFKIINEVKRLCELDIDAINEYRNKLIPILEHNYNVFMDKKDYLITYE